MGDSEEIKLYFDYKSQHELEIDRPDEVAAVVLELGDSADDYRAFLAGPLQAAGLGL